MQHSNNRPFQLPQEFCHMKIRFDLRSNQQNANLGRQVMTLCFTAIVLVTIAIVEHPGLLAQAQSIDQSVDIASRDELAGGSDWQPIETDEIQSAVESWLESPQFSEDDRRETKRATADLLADGNFESKSRLDLVIATILISRPELGKVFHDLTLQNEYTTAVYDQMNTQISDLKDRTKTQTAAPFVINHARLMFARSLAQCKMYDEAITQLDQVPFDQISDRTTWLFYRGLAEHQLMRKSECIATLEKLMQHKSQLPSRFATVGNMMLADIKPLEDDSLNQISRMMKDVRRRMSFNRSGKIVLNVESDVIERLDKLIEKIEQQQQQQQQQQQSQSQPGANKTSKPMEDSMEATQKGDGKVPNKRLPDGGEWGNMPPEKRAAALAEMTKGMPPHYRAAIEEYFRKLAKEENR